jgi:hypothetical protein
MTAEAWVRMSTLEQYKYLEAGHPHPLLQEAALQQAQVDAETEAAFETTNASADVPLQKHWFRKGLRRGMVLASLPSQPPAPGEVEQAKDAARYRWLREQCLKHDGVTIAKVNGWGDGLEGWSGDDPDANIDAAMAAPLPTKD